LIDYAIVLGAGRENMHRHGQIAAQNTRFRRICPNSFDAAKFMCRKIFDHCCRIAAASGGQNSQ
jgi:hypothetical protein